MKRSSPSLQFLAAAASTDATTTIMSSRSRYRGGRNQWRRGFSDRTSGDGSDQYVSGDSHFRSVRDANRGFRPAERGNFANQNSFRPQPRYPSFNPQPPRFNSRPLFDHHNPPPFNQNQPFQPPPPPFYPNQQFRPPQQFRPRPQKPLDYRNWEYARPGPPPDCERFTVLSYNILADYLATNHRSKLYFHIPRHILNWEFRKRNIIFELGLWSADILCFQEVDRFQDLQDELQVRGYSGIWKMRTGDPVDGCAIFWRFSRFKLLQEESIEFNKLGLRDNIAQICVLESMNQNNNRCTSAHPASAAGSNKVVICNIHVLYNPRRGEIKLGQIRVLLSRAYAVSKLWDDAPVVLCGDFNFTPKSPLYNFISEQKLNLSELPRDKLSGQASAEIHSPRPFIANFRPQSVGDSAQTPTMVVENSALSYEPIKGHQGNEDACKDETELTLSVPVSGLNESPSSSLGEGGCSVDQMKDGVHECSPINSHCEDIYSNVIETGQREDIYATSNASSGSSGEHSQANLHPENKILNCEKVTNGNDCASTLYGSDVQYKSASIDSVVDEKMENLCLNEPIEATEDGTLEHFFLNEPIEATVDGTLGEDCTTFLSELHNTEGHFPSEFGERNKSSEVLDDSLDMDSEPVDVGKTTYDPSAWTPMEIETATGSSDCTIMEHPLKLRSTYSEVEDYSGTRDSNGEPLVTSYNRCFLGTVDYIWYSEGLQTARVLAPIQRHAMQWTPGFPTKKWGSDHIALVSELAFTKDGGAR